MKVYRTPIYPALMVKLGEKSIKASGGLFDIEDEDVAAFEKFIAKRPHYRITPYAGDPNTSPDPDNLGERELIRQNGGVLPEPVPNPHGEVTQPEPISASERQPEIVETPESLANYSNDYLRAQLTERGLPAGGNHSQLVQRLADAMELQTGGPDASDDDDDDEDLDEDDE